jgi:predicted phosphohydrolase
MQFSFDLISDLHLDTWSSNFDWSEQATSPYCVIAGDIASNHELTIHCLKHLSKCYQAVFYIDGNSEHSQNLENLGKSYKSLEKNISKIPNVVYLQDNVVVINGVAILGTNGWWSYDFDIGIDAERTREWFQEKYSLTPQVASSIRQAANTDAIYMASSVKRLQTHQDVKKIVMITHTVPRPDLIQHDKELSGAPKFNIMGNRTMDLCLETDSMKKIHTWCFGHYHGKVDQIRNGVRYVNNCKGRQNSTHSQWTYYPLRITVDI